MVIKTKKERIRKINALTNKISREYSKGVPDRTKIAGYAEKAARLLRTVKRRK